MMKCNLKNMMLNYIKYTYHKTYGVLKLILLLVNKSFTILISDFSTAK